MLAPSITLTIGERDDTLRSIENYGLFLRGFDEGEQVEATVKKALDDLARAFTDQ